jgi:hypothetical protein
MWAGKTGGTSIRSKEIVFSWSALVRAARAATRPINNSTAHQRRTWRAILQRAHAVTPALTKDELESLWGLDGIWTPDTDTSEISVQDSTELIAPRGPEALNAEFVLDWLSRPEEERNAINARTEEYRDYADFREREIFSPGMLSSLEKQLRPADITADSIGRIVASLAWDPKIRSNPAYRDRMKRQVDALIWEAWGIDRREAHAPLKDARNREWSRMMYLGRTAKDLAAESNISEEKIRKAVDRHRERRVVLRWVLRAAILTGQN